MASSGMSDAAPSTSAGAGTVAGADRDRPRQVFVDLDGTLIRSDLLWESLRLLFSERRIGAILRAPFWLLRGKAHFKGRLAGQVAPVPGSLPYRQAVLDYLCAARSEGATLVLASASPRPWVEAVAAHLGLFDGVLSSSEGENLSGETKLAAIRARVGDAPFEYLGDRAVDIPIWRAAQRATAVAPSAAARRGLARLPQHHEIPTEEAAVGRQALRAMRPHQWAKNALLLAPLLLAHQLGDLTRLLSIFAAFVAFCAVSSAGYVLNDLVDVEADRAHPTKRHRPIASGALPLPTAFALLAALLAAAGLVSLLGLTWAATGMVAAYLALTLSYSFYFKELLLLDVLLLAGLYTHRVLAGGVAAEVAVSPWLLVFSTFFFSSLALVKRYVELCSMDRQGTDASISRRAYRIDDRPLVESMGLACAYIAVLVLCLFVSSDDVSQLYRTPALLWLMPPVMFYWISRIWVLAHRGDLHDDPVLFATTDRNSYAAGALLVIIVVAAT